MPTVEILKDNELKAQMTVDDLLDCYSFWISWKDGLIEIGRGSSREDGRLVSWFDSDPYDVNIVDMSTGENHKGDWEFVRLKGKYIPGLLFI